jgi:hypothetical protein
MFWPPSVSAHAGRRIAREGSMIGPRILDTAKRMMGKLLDENLDQIDKAFLKSDAGLKMTLTVAIIPESQEVQILEVKLNFVAARIKARSVKFVSESQAELIPEKEKNREGRQ